MALAASDVPAASPRRDCLVRWLGRVPYEPTWRAMQRYTDERGPESPDELWLLEHEPVYTLGMNADARHVLEAGDVPLVRIDRGGQVTYHGPGQLVAYLLIDLRRGGLGVRELVTACERGVVELARGHGIEAEARPRQPGVYVAGRKLASVGLRVRRGGSYHGLALNVAMDLGPFARINPCGYAGLEMTQLSALGVGCSVREAGEALAPHLLAALGMRAVPPQATPL